MSTTVVWVQASGEEARAFGGAGTDFIGLMARASMTIALVQRAGAKRVSDLQPGTGKDPMAGVDNFVGSDRHGPGIGEDHAEQVGFGFDLVMEAALAVRWPGVQTAHARATVEVFDRTVDP